MTYRLSILLIFCSIALFGQNKSTQLALTNAEAVLRSGPGSKYKILGHIRKGELLYSESAKAGWVKISTISCENKKPVKGYVPSNQLLIIEKLNPGEKQQFLMGVLKQQQQLANQYQLGYPTADSLIHQKITETFVEHTQSRYFPVLKIIPDYVCQNNDSVIMKQLFATIWADGGSPDDMPPLAMAYCHTCHPQWVEMLISSLKNAEMRQLMLDNIQWGNEAIVRRGGKAQEIRK
jgi:hypothetical protein